MPVLNYAAASGPAIEFVRDWSRRGEVLVLAATRAAADDLLREACGAALAGVHRFALREFVYAAASTLMNQRGLTPLRQIGREALAARVTDVAVKEARLSYLRPIAGFPGFPRALARTIEKLRLERAAAPYADLAELLALYERELRERSLVDHAGRVELALASLDAHFGGLPLLLFDVEPETEAERELTDALRRRAPAVLVAEGGAGSGSLGALQTRLFAGEADARPADDSFAIFSASGEALECVEIARRILHSGVPFDECAVLLRDSGRYQPLMAEALRRAGIPVYFSSGTRRPDAAGRALLALLRCAEENCSASAFAEYLSLQPMAAPARWERLLVDAAVIGGADRWRRRIDGLIEESVLKFNASGEHAMLRRIEQLEALAAFALPLIEQLEALPRAATWGEWIDALYGLTDAPAVHELLEELAPMSEIGPVTIADVVRVLHPRLTELRESSDHARYGCVFVGSIEDGRGIAFRHVYIPGVNEGSFPRPFTQDPLLPGAPQDDAALLRVACACASERVVLSWSRLDLLTGRARVPSFYAFEALRAARGGEVDVKGLEEEAREAADARIGWPAPATHEKAIDDLEFDLAYLRPAWEQRIPGAAAYLTKVNGHAARSLRARWRRWKEPWRAADGFVDLDMHALKVLGKHRLSARAWSPTALQQYARCPYRFVLRGVMELHEQERPTALQVLDPATRGRIYHEVQFRLLRQDGADVDAILREVADEYKERLCPAIPQVWDAGIESIRTDLQGWLLFRSAYDKDWSPERCEFSFGMKEGEGRDPRSQTEPIAVLDGVLLKGSMDLVERHTSGHIRVVDHKTGAPPKQPVVRVGGGEHLQAVLYALAADKVFGEGVIGGRLFYSTLRQNYKTVDIPLDALARDGAQKVADEINRALHEGFLPAAPREGGCSGCEYLPVCGPWEEERVLRKSPAEIRPLKQLRGLP